MGLQNYLKQARIMEEISFNKHTCISGEILYQFPVREILLVFVFQDYVSHQSHTDHRHRRPQYGSPRWLSPSIRVWCQTFIRESEVEEERDSDK